MKMADKFANDSVKEKSGFDDLELIPIEPLVDLGKSILCKFVFRCEKDRLKRIIIKYF